MLKTVRKIQREEVRRSFFFFHFIFVITLLFKLSSLLIFFLFSINWVIYEFRNLSIQLSVYKFFIVSMYIFICKHNPPRLA